MAAFGWVCLGAFTLVFFVVPGGLWLADTLSLAFHRWARRRVRAWKRDIAAKILAEQNMTAVPLDNNVKPSGTVSVEQLVRIIRSMEGADR